MRKTITILSALAITGSPALALNITTYNTQNLKNIFKPATTTTSKSNGVANTIITQDDETDRFFFQARLSNSTNNGFPAFSNQIGVYYPWWPQQQWPIFFFQWLDDNNYNGNFPNLSQFTKHGYFHDPISWPNRLDEHMGPFGDVFDNKSNCAFNMILAGKGSFWNSYAENVQNTYNKDAASGNVIGIDLNFGFTYDGDYHAVKPNFVILTS